MPIPCEKVECMASIQNSRRSVVLIRGKEMTFDNPNLL